MNPISQSMEVKIRLEVCEAHGEFESRNLFRSIWSKCPQCGIEQEAREKAEREQNERQAKQEAWRQRLGIAEIPDRFRECSLSSYRVEIDGQRRALEFAESYADNFSDALATGRSALFLGKLGTGKTHLAAGIGLRIMRRDGRTVLFSTVMKAIRRVKDTWRKESEETESQAIAALAFPDLLILDEVGVQVGNEMEKRIMFDVLNERYENRQPTLLMSNLTIGEVGEYLGERVIDRLREGGGEVVVFDWESYRGRVKK